MKRISLTLFLAFACITVTFSQVKKDGKKVSDKEAKEILSQINIDTARFMREYAAEACLCIDSITLSKKSSEEISDDISKCIDKSVSAYQVMIKIYGTLTGGSNNITINTDKSTEEYQRYYYEMERWLRDSCTSLKDAVNAENKESALSKSKDPKAMEYYQKGVLELDDDNYKDALPWFEKAVKQDPVFAFAWDNIGICKRRLNDLDGALVAYNKSLELDPKGKIPLHNIPVVYEHKKDYDKALKAYENIATVYPNDPEAYYGAGRMYALKENFEKALDNMCKAYKAYIKLSSPYRVDAEKNINYLYKKLKDAGKEETFNKILKDNNIQSQ